MWASDIRVFPLGRHCSQEWFSDTWPPVRERFARCAEYAESEIALAETCLREKNFRGAVGDGGALKHFENARDAVRRLHKAEPPWRWREVAHTLAGQGEVELTTASALALSKTCSGHIGACLEAESCAEWPAIQVELAAATTLAEAEAALAETFVQRGDIHGATEHFNSAYAHFRKLYKHKWAGGQTQGWGPELLLPGVEQTFRAARAAQDNAIKRCNWCKCEIYKQQKRARAEQEAKEREESRRAKFCEEWPAISVELDGLAEDAKWALERAKEFMQVGDYSRACDNADDGKDLAMFAFGQPVWGGCGGCSTGRWYDECKERGRRGPAEQWWPGGMEQVCAELEGLERACCELHSTASEKLGEQQKVFDLALKHDCDHGGNTALQTPYGLLKYGEPPLALAAPAPAVVPQPVQPALAAPTATAGIPAFAQRMADAAAGCLVAQSPCAVPAPATQAQPVLVPAVPQLAAAAAPPPAAAQQVAVAPPLGATSAGRGGGGALQHALLRAPCDALKPGQKRMLKKKLCGAAARSDGAVRAGQEGLLESSINGLEEARTTFCADNGTVYTVSLAELCKQKNNDSQDSSRKRKAGGGKEQGGEQVVNESRYTNKTGQYLTSTGKEDWVALGKGRGKRYVSKHVK